jgi:hypothetical protein
MLDPTKLPPQERGLSAIGAAMAIIAVLLIVQMWLLTATLEAYLAGDAAAPLPAAIVSGILFAACAALYLFIHRINASVEKR